MKVVRALEQREELQRMPGIANRRLEIDDAVVRAAGADEFVDRLPARVLVRRVVAGSDGAEVRAFERQEGAGDDFQAVRVRALDDLPVPGDDLGGRRQRLAVAAEPEIVDALEQDDVRDAALREDVAVEARERAQIGRASCRERGGGWGGAGAGE